MQFLVYIGGTKEGKRRGRKERERGGRRGRKEREEREGEKRSSS